MPRKRKRKPLFSSRRKKKKYEKDDIPAIDSYFKELGLECDRILEFKALTLLSRTSSYDDPERKRILYIVFNPAKYTFYPCFDYLRYLFLYLPFSDNCNDEYINRMTSFINPHRNDNPVMKIICSELCDRLEILRELNTRTRDCTNYLVKMFDAHRLAIYSEIESRMKHIELSDKQKIIMKKICFSRDVYVPVFTPDEEKDEEMTNKLIELILTNVPIFMCMTRWISTRQGLYEMYIHMGIRPEIITIFACLPHFEGKVPDIRFTAVDLAKEYKNKYDPYWKGLPCLLNQITLPVITPLVTDYLRCIE